MDKDNYITLKDENNKELNVEVLFTFESSENNKTYVVYTDHSKDSDQKEKVFAGIYDEKKSMLNPIETKEDYNLIENILSSIEKKNS